MRHSLSRVVDEPGSLALLRWWLREHLDGSDELRFRAGLVCTELVGNALEHTSGDARVFVHATDDGLAVEVDDDDPAAVLTPGRSRFGGHRGHGLVLVDAVAEWGVRRHDDHKTVWALIPLDVT